MKTIALSTLLLLFYISGFSQEGLKASVHAGYPLGDISDNSIVNVQANVDYLFHITQEIHVGGTLGYSHFLAKNEDGVDLQDFVYLPLGGTVQFHLNDYFKVGGDIGYGVVLTPNNLEGNFYFAPELYYILTDTTALILSYRSLAIDSGSVNAITLGFELSLSD